MLVDPNGFARIRAINFVMVDMPLGMCERVRASFSLR